ncbi:MAG: DUF5752 family protein [Nitrospirae bacterium]|nr:DUF5752 family protein [Nitrospirota bacterium]
MDEIRPFEFMQCETILKATGKKAGSLRELRDVIAKVSDNSLIHHTYQYFLKGHILEHTNDFAHWAGVYLEERALSEHLSFIDPYTCADVGDLRQELLGTIDRYLENFPEPREVMPGDAFFFNETIMIIAPSGLKAKNLAEFLIAIKYIDTSSIYYHFYEARRRLGHRSDDFSQWFEDTLQKEDLAARIRAIDPFMHNSEGIREHISLAVEEAVRQDMEVMGVER